MSKNKVTMNRVTRRAVSAAAATAGAVLLTSCASSHPAAAGGTSGATSGLKTESTSIGTVAAAASGHTLYELVGNTTTKPMCTGSCLSIWPAATASGTQVILRGHPAYTFAQDKVAGEVAGQGVKDQWGTWYALDGSGNPITKAVPAGGASSSSSKGGGGYNY